MKIRHKRLVAIVTALMLILCAALPAFAEAESGKNEHTDEAPWRGVLRVIGAIASYVFVFGIIIIGLGFFIARYKTGRRGY